MKPFRFAPLAAALLLAACADPAPADDTAAEESDFTSGTTLARASFAQSGGRIVPVDRRRDIEEVTLAPEAFELLLPTIRASAAVHIAAWTDATVFDIPLGTPVAQHPLFGDGHGMADEPAGRGALVLATDAFSYFPRERAFTRDATTDAIPFFFIQKRGSERMDPVRVQTAPIYLALFTDANENGIFDAGEVERLIVRFAK